MQVPAKHSKQVPLSNIRGRITQHAATQAQPSADGLQAVMLRRPDRVTLVEANEVLGSFDVRLREYAASKLHKQGVHLIQVLSCHPAR